MEKPFISNPFQISDFTGSLEEQKQKCRLANSLCTFIHSGFGKNFFTLNLYNDIIKMWRLPSHFNNQIFYNHYFCSDARTLNEFFHIIINSFNTRIPPYKGENWRREVEYFIGQWILTHEKTIKARFSSESARKAGDTLYGRKRKDKKNLVYA